MTFIVNRDAEGVVSINYTEGGASISLHGQPDTFSDSFAAQDKATELAAEGADKPAEADTPPAPFKCPACGAEYAEQVTCTNQHPAEQTLPTEEVIGGAASTGATDTPQPPATTETPQEPAPAETPPGPTFPA